MGQAQAILNDALALAGAHWQAMVLVMAALMLFAVWWALRHPLDEMEGELPGGMTELEPEPETELQGDEQLATTVVSIHAHMDANPLLAGRLRRLRADMAAGNERATALRQARLRDMGIKPPRNLAECDALLKQQEIAR